MPSAIPDYSDPQDFDQPADCSPGLFQVVIVERQFDQEPQYRLPGRDDPLPVAKVPPRIIVIDVHALPRNG